MGTYQWTFVNAWHVWGSDQGVCILIWGLKFNVSSPLPSLFFSPKEVLSSCVSTILSKFHPLIMMTKHKVLMPCLPYFVDIFNTYKLVQGLMYEIF
jgi:hypothetical protein